MGLVAYQIHKGNLAPISNEQTHIRDYDTIFNPKHLNYELMGLYYEEYWMDVILATRGKVLI